MRWKPAARTVWTLLVKQIHLKTLESRSVSALAQGAAFNPPTLFSVSGDSRRRDATRQLASLPENGQAPSRRRDGGSC